LAATAIAMPKLGMTMEEGSVVSWPLPLGAPVAKGQVVLVIESEKSEAEIESAAAGFLRHIYIEAGAEAVPCGALLAAITETADEEFDAEAFSAAYAAAQPPSAAKPAPATPTAPSAAPARNASTSAARRPVAPAARALARKLGIDVKQVAGSGPGGRVTRGDVSAHAEARERLVPVAESVALEVLREGAGPCVLLLPGFGSDVSSFAPQTAALREHFAVAGVNPRGVGHSDAPPSGYEVKQAAADAAAVLRKLDCGPAHIVGASLGAAAAMELAFSQPQLVRSLALLTPFVSAAPRLLAVLEAWQRIAAETGPTALAQSLAPWLFGDSLLGNAAQLARTLRGLAASLARTPPDILARSAAGLAAWSRSRSGDLNALGNALAEQGAPLLVLAAGADLLTPDAESLAAQIPGARCMVIPGAGHALASDAPAAVTEALLAHLQAG